MLFTSLLIRFLRLNTPFSAGYLDSQGDQITVGVVMIGHCSRIDKCLLNLVGIIKQGWLALLRQRVDWQTLPTDDAEQPGCQYFPNTRQNVCGDILAAWRTNGLDLGDPGISEGESIALFGLPISPLQEEEIEGRVLQVQWFQRARFELHPENNPPFNVLLGRLGSELITANPDLRRPE